ncbi:hypothetical protein DFH11DRAFT_1582338 [Phellopilus nigrolimitatus]|nr:hypothetical protein DFH11DRAFT_1582338 [Phellopilus nigrolimitatus]
MAAFGDLLGYVSFSLPFLSRTCACTYGLVRYLLLRSEFRFPALRVGSSFGWGNIKICTCTLFQPRMRALKVARIDKDKYEF